MCSSFTYGHMPESCSPVGFQAHVFPMLKGMCLIIHAFPSLQTESALTAANASAVQSVEELSTCLWIVSLQAEFSLCLWLQPALRLLQLKAEILLFLDCGLKSFS